jgi:general stress protein YciG
MAGTKEGGMRAAATNKRKYGDDFYAKVGAKGGKASGTGGFYANRELARLAGAKGGRISRRRKKTETGQSATTAYRVNVRSGEVTQVKPIPHVTWEKAKPVQPVKQSKPWWRKLWRAKSE